MPEHLPELFVEQIQMQRGYVVSQANFKLQPEFKKLGSRDRVVYKEVITGGI